MLKSGMVEVGSSGYDVIAYRRAPFHYLLLGTVTTRPLTTTQKQMLQYVYFRTVAFLNN